jgi:hypothetical protein
MTPLQNSKYFPNCFYRVSAKGLCVRDGKVLLIQDSSGRSDTDSRPQWELREVGWTLVRALRKHWFDK